MASETTATTTPKVNAIVLTSFGGGSDYSNLKVQQEDYPKLPSQDHVIVRVKACGLNFAELMQRQGFYSPAQKVPYTPGFEGAGVITELGSDVKDYKVGDRVIVTNSHNIWKDVVCVPSANVIKMPDEMSFEDGAALTVNYMTAYHLLFDLGNLRPGSKVLIHMAAGGVGFAATQLCKTVANVTVFGTASAGKHEQIRANGVDYPIDYKTQNYVDEIKKISPDGVDIILDPLNGEDSIKGYNNLLRPLGKIIHFGAANMTTENRSFMSAIKTWLKCLSVNSLNIISQNKSVAGYHLGYLLGNSAMTEKLKVDFQTLLDLYRNGKIKMMIDSRHPFSKVGEAMHRIHARLNVGKIVLIPDSEFQQQQQQKGESS